MAGIFLSDIVQDAPAHWSKAIKEESASEQAQNLLGIS